MVDAYFYFVGSKRRIFLEVDADYDDAEITAVKFARNNLLPTFEVTSKSIQFLRIDGVIKDPPLTAVTIIITSHKE